MMWVIVALAVAAHGLGSLFSATVGEAAAKGDKRTVKIGLVMVSVLHFVGMILIIVAVMVERAS